MEVDQIPFSSLSLSGLDIQNEKLDQLKGPIRPREIFLMVDEADIIQISVNVKSLESKDEDTILESLKSLAQLTSWNSCNKLIVAEIGGLPIYTKLLNNTYSNLKNEIAQHVCWVLMNLASHGGVVETMASDANLLSSVVDLLQSTDENTSLYAIRIIDSLACSTGPPQEAITKTDAIHLLVDVVMNSNSHDGKLKWAAAALAQMAVLPSVHTELLALDGFAEKLVSLLKHRAGGVVYFVGQLLGQLAAAGCNAQALLLRAGAAEYLTSLVSARNSSLAAVALRALLQIAVGNALTGAAVGALPLLPQQLTDLASAITDRGLDNTPDDALALLALHELVCVLGVWPSHASTAGGTCREPVAPSQVWSRAESYMAGLSAAATALGVQLPAVKTWEMEHKPSELEVAEVVHRLHSVHGPALLSRNRREILAGLAGAYQLAMLLPSVARHALGSSAFVGALVTVLEHAQDGNQTEILQAALPLVAAIASSRDSAFLLWEGGAVEAVEAHMESSDPLVALGAQRVLGALAAHVSEADS